ncbi:hypothetical protein [Planktotalea sp.]|uniref:calcium-binding protein n=1 Tax=Planktotalea sp. TaxID=2029877 RepID=UPI003D6B259D
MANLTWDTTTLDGTVVNGSGFWDEGTTTSWTSDGGFSNTVFNAGDSATFHLSTSPAVTTVSGVVSLGGVTLHTGASSGVSHNFAGGTLDFISGSSITSQNANVAFDIGSNITSLGGLTINATSMTFGGAMSLVGTLTLTNYSTNLTNHGSINNALHLTNGASIFNHGTINGDVTMNYANVHNYGTIDGALDVGDAFVSNHGTITGPVTLGMYGNFVEHGFITDLVTVTSGTYSVGGVQISDTVIDGGRFAVESGDMFGSVTVSAGVTPNSNMGNGQLSVYDTGSFEALSGTAFTGNEHSNGVDNGGSIEGDLFFHGGNDSFRSYSGVTIGSLDMGEGNDTVSLNDTAILDGTLDMGDGDDVLTVSARVELSGRVSGGEGDDMLRGSRGANDLRGGADSDFILGRAGADVLHGNDDEDLIFGGSGYDTIKGGDGHDLLFGGSGRDVIKGGSGIDQIVGGKGADTLFGGADSDVFIFTDIGHFGGSGGNNDLIQDYANGPDVIDLSAIDANTNTVSNDDFFFIDSLAFSNQAGELRYEFDGSKTTLSGDVDGDGAADFELDLAGNVGLSDFIFDGVLFLA